MLRDKCGVTCGLRTVDGLNMKPCGAACPCRLIFEVRICLSAKNTHRRKNLNLDWLIPTNPTL